MPRFEGKGLGAALVLGLVTGGTLPATAQETVKVGTETKRAAGTVVSLTAGDVACYIKLKDDRGTTFEEMAGFEICGQRTLVGKRVALTYAMNKVQSPACQGDPDCKKTVAVALVTAARVVAAPTPPAPATAARPPSTWCSANELVVFNCATNTRIISACASKGATADSGSLQYRFGKPDGAEPEIVQPRDKVVPSKAALGSNFPLSGGGGAWLRFTSGELVTTLYSAIGRFGPKGEVRERGGLVATKQGKEVASFKCVGTVSGELGPDWFARVGIGDGGQDFDMPE